MRKSNYFIYILLILFFFKNLYGYEIIRDPIIENYFEKLSKSLNLNKTDVYLVKNDSENAFVINNNIYFTTGLFKEITNEDTIKAIYLHEYGHIINKHYQAKKVKIQESSNKGIYLTLFSLGLAVISGNANVGIGANITLKNKFIDEITNHSLIFEIEADNFMYKHVSKNRIDVSELILFLGRETNKNKYFRTHPSNTDRINNLKELNNYNSSNSNEFNWIKSKYSQNSENNLFNLFFKNLDKGIYDANKNFKEIDESLTKYEAFKKGFNVENWETIFEKLILSNNNSFLKIEYINYILDNNLYNKYSDIEDFKFNENILKEYFYYYIYGKYYNKLGKNNLSNFYFCQFYKYINSKNKADFFCKKYDIKDIPILDKSYALFK